MMATLNLFGDFFIILMIIGVIVWSPASTK